MPQLRLGYPPFEQRLVPYAVAGMGIGLAEFGDRTPASQGLTFSQAQDLSVVGGVGDGVPYTSRLNGFLVSAGLRVFFN